MGVEELRTALQALLGEPDTQIADLRRLSGGASRETWSFDAVRAGAREPLILQRLRPGAAGATTGLPMQVEAGVLRVAGGHGVPVAEVVADDDGGTLGTPGMVLRRLDGETIPRKILRDDAYATAREVLVGQVAEAASRIHALPLDQLRGLPQGDPVDQLRELHDALGEPHPAFELGFRWLDANRPTAERRSVVHGDLRLGNLLVGPQGLVALLDWELAHVGDPVEDLGWFCVRAWRFGSPLTAGGLAAREELVAAYEAAAGVAVEHGALRWWEVLGTLRWGVICQLQAHAHLSGASRSVELATIGRRVCENEWDILALLPGEPLPVARPPEPTAGASLHDRPTLGELVEAVREWVERDVRDAHEGRLAFDARVAANALRIVEREVALEPALTADHHRRLAAFAVHDDRGLAAAIRDGRLDDRAEEVRQAIAESVRDKLLVANPRWLEGAEG